VNAERKSSQIPQTLAISSFVAARCPGWAIGACDRLYLILPLGDRQSTRLIADRLFKEKDLTIVAREMDSL
jgi:hypothetical protein